MRVWGRPRIQAHFRYFFDSTHANTCRLAIVEALHSWESVQTELSHDATYILNFYGLFHIESHDYHFAPGRTSTGTTSWTGEIARNRCFGDNCFSTWAALVDNRKGFFSEEVAHHCYTHVFCTYITQYDPIIYEGEHVLPHQRVLVEAANFSAEACGGGAGRPIAVQFYSRTALDIRPIYRLSHRRRVTESTSAPKPPWPPIQRIVRVDFRSNAPGCRRTRRNGARLLDEVRAGDTIGSFRRGLSSYSTKKNTNDYHSRKKGSATSHLPLCTKGRPETDRITLWETTTRNFILSYSVVVVFLLLLGSKKKRRQSLQKKKKNEGGYITNFGDEYYLYERRWYLYNNGCERHKLKRNCLSQRLRAKAIGVFRRNLLHNTDNGRFTCKPCQSSRR